MSRHITLDDEHAILELYQSWAHFNADTFRGDWTRVPRHLDLFDSHQRCDYFERRRFRICKLTGILYLHPHSQCTGVCGQCPYITETRFGEMVCSVTGTILRDASFSASAPTGFNLTNKPTRQDVERINVDSPFYNKKKMRQVASFETMAGPIRTRLLALAHNLIAECFVLHRIEDAPLIESLACAFFFHTEQNIAAFRRVTAAFLRIVSTHPPDSFPQLPAVKLETFNVRNWPSVVGCEQNSITQTEKRVLQWLRTFQWTGEWLIRPEQIRETGHRYMDTLQQCLPYESITADQLMTNLDSTPSPSSTPVSVSSLMHNL